MTNWGQPRLAMTFRRLSFLFLERKRKQKELYHALEPGIHPGRSDDNLPRPLQPPSFVPRFGAPQNPQILWGEEEQTERREACPKGGIHKVQFVLTRGLLKGEQAPP